MACSDHKAYRLTNGLEDVHFGRRVSEGVLNNGEENDVVVRPTFDRYHMRRFVDKSQRKALHLSTVELINDDDIMRRDDKLDVHLNDSHHLLHLVELSNTLSVRH